MGLLSFLQRRRDPASAEPPAPDAPPDAVALARRRARQRLIGASVLLAIGVIGFPLLFETQPRPIAVDIPIEMPQRDKAPPLVLTPAPGAAPTVTDPAPPPRVPGPELTERAGDAGQEVAPQAGAKPGASAPAAAAAPTPATERSAAARPTPEARPAAEARPVAESKPAAEPKPAAEAKPAAATKPPAAATTAPAAGPTAAATAAPASKPAPAKPAAASQDAARAQALLEGKPAPAAAAPAADAASRVVVQVGAYTEAEKLRQVRAKLESLGFKTYTQVVESNGERRTRVRVGPFANRAEADKAAARIKSAGLQAAILTL